MATYEATECTWLFLMKKKSDLCKNMLGLILDLNSKRKIKVKYIRCDTAGENKKLDEACKNKGLGITFEYTALGTSQ